MNAKKPLRISFLFLPLLLLINAVSAQENFAASSIPSAELCPCSNQAYAVAVQNTGTTASSYEALASGNAAEWVAFKPSKFALNSGQKGSFFVYVNSVCNIRGDYNLSIFIKTGKGLAKAINQNLKFSECYDYSLEQGEAVDSAKSISFARHEGAYSLCKDEKKSIPVLITNNENFENRYLIQLDAPQFATLSLNKVQLAAKKSGVFLINIDATNAEGEFNFNLDAVSELGKVQRKNSIKVDIGECYALEVNLEKEKDSVCSGESKSYNAAVKNSGTLSQNATLKLDGPEWASIENTSFSLKPGEEKGATLGIIPPDNVSGNFLITLSAMIENKTTRFSDGLGIDVTPKFTCYEVVIGAKKSIKNFYSKDFFFAKAKNEGIRKSVYNISLEGVPWASVSPKSLELNPGQAANLNIGVNPGMDVGAGTYSVKINLESNNIIYSKSVDIIVKKENEFLKKAKSLAIYYLYYFYLFLVIIALLIIFRKPIKRAKDAIKESYRQHKIRSQRIMALKLAREKRAEEKRKEKELEEKRREAEEEKTRKAELKGAKKERERKLKAFWKEYKAWAYALVLLFVISAVGVFFGNYYKLFNAKYMHIYIRNFFYGYLYYILIGVGIVIALFLLLSLYRHISKKRNENTEFKTEAKKAEKKSRKGKKSRYKAYFKITAAVLIAAALIYVFAYNTNNPSLSNIINKVKDFFVLYSYYFILGIAILIAIILLIRFYKPLAKMLKE